MKKLITTLFYLIPFTFVLSQDPCDGRYLEEIFSEVEVTTVTYSEENNLQMDIYQPVGDVETSRPLIIFAHGGTFIFGSKNNGTAVEFCEAFAKRGYVTASINYRLSGDLLGFWQQFTYYQNTNTAYEVVLSATMDGKAAIRYFRKDFVENNNTYGIDPNQIWAGGNSAGGVLFLHAGHVLSIDEFIAPLDPTKAAIAQEIFDDLGGIEGSSGNAGYSSNLSGVISLAGALHRTEYVNQNDIPAVFCHGDADGTVPYDCNGFQNNPSLDQLCGGGSLNPQFQSLGLDSDLLIFPNDDHCPWSSNSSKMEQVLNFVSDFVYERINCDSSSSLIEKNTDHSTLIYQTNLLGKSIDVQSKGFIFSVFKNGKVEKKYILK